MNKYGKRGTKTRQGSTVRIWPQFSPFFARSYLAGVLWLSDCRNVSVWSNDDVIQRYQTFVCWKRIAAVEYFRPFPSDFYLRCRLNRNHLSHAIYCEKLKKVFIFVLWPFPSHTIFFPLDWFHEICSPCNYNIVHVIYANGDNYYCDNFPRNRLDYYSYHCNYR